LPKYVRRRIAWEYLDAVDRLIQSGQRQEAPLPEEQLPHDFMPAAFFAFWTDQLNGYYQSEKRGNGMTPPTVRRAIRSTF
jgi:hypothetical protein